MSTTDVHHSPTQLGATDPPRRGRLWRSRWAAIGAAVAVTLGGGTLHLAGATASEPSSIISITPTRILDTRDPTDLGLTGPFVSAVGQDLQVTGQVATTAGAQTVVPDGATGVLLNVTVVQPTAAGFVSVRPAGTAGPPQTSSLNFEAGDITPNAVFVALPTDGADAGRIEITYDAFGTPGPTTDILGDVVGYTMELVAPDGAVDAYTKAEADELFLTDVDAYTKNEADGAFLPLFAVVEVNGSLVRGRGVNSTALLGGVPNGRYEVIFDRDISECAYQATVGRPGVNSGPPIGFALVANRSGNATNGVAVFVKDQNGAGVERGFHLTVHC